MAVKRYQNPKFKSREEEQEYWQTHSPLAEGYEAVLQRESTRRASFLSIRLDGAEIEALRKMATAQGVPPGTLARHLILEGLRAQEQANELNKRVVTLERKLEEVERALAESGARTPS